MAQIGSAGTLAGAVLENAGLASQEFILREFAPFFESAGGFLYVMAGIGAVVSVLLFGSYRMGRYLLLGPILFWVLVGAKTEVGGVVHQLGGGDPRDFVGETTAAEAAESMGAVAERGKISNDALPPYEVSAVFALFTGLINDFVLSAVDTILKYENGKDLLFITRTQAFGDVFSAQIENSETLSMIQGAFNAQCGEMMSASLALASPNLNPQTIELLESQEAAAPGTAVGLEARRRIDLLQSEIDQYREIYNQAAAQIMTPDLPMRTFMARVQGVTGATRNVLQSFYTAFPAYSGQTVEQIGSNLKLRCSQAWEVLVQAIFIDARGMAERNLLEFSPSATTAASRNALEAELCAELSEKVKLESGYRASDSNSATNTTECSLVPMYAMFLIRNAVSSPSTANSYIQHHKNMMQLVSGNRPNDRLLPQAPDPAEWEVNGTFGVDAPIRHEEGQVEVEYRRVGCEGSDCETKWFTASWLAPVVGQFDTAFSEHQSYQAFGLSQRIFIYSLQVPYWQGVLLYLISVCYPILALIVILPSHAQGFMYVPLAWLWIKSWDIGFALVRVLDKVLWNLFPQSDLTAGQTFTALGRPVDLPNLMIEAYKVDPTYHVHNYYFILSVAMFAVPGVTGYAIMKGKRAILSSFTDAPRKMADPGGEAAETAFGMDVIQAKDRAVSNRRAVAGLGHRMSVIGNNHPGFDQAKQLGIGIGAVTTAASVGGAATGIINGGSRRTGQDAMNQLLSMGQNGIAPFSTMQQSALKHMIERSGMWGDAVGMVSAESAFSTAARGALETDSFGFDPSGAWRMFDAEDALANLFMAVATQHQAASLKVIESAGQAASNAARGTLNAAGLSRAQPYLGDLATIIGITATAGGAIVDMDGSNDHPDGEAGQVLDPLRETLEHFRFNNSGVYNAIEDQLDSGELRE